MAIPMAGSSFTSVFSKNKKGRHVATGGFASPMTFGGTVKPVAPASPTAAAPKPDALATYKSDPLYQSGQSVLDLNKQNALGNITKQRDFLSRSYGFNSDGTENSSDPFSRLASLKADYEKIKRGSSASYAARGLGYDGSYQNKVESNQTNSLRATDALKKDFSAQDMALQSEATGVESRYNSDLYNLGSSTVERLAAQAAESPEEAPAAPSPQTRKDKVLAALNGKLGASVRKRLTAEAKANGWA